MNPLGYEACMIHFSNWRQNALSFQNIVGLLNYDDGLMGSVQNISHSLLFQFSYQSLQGTFSAYVNVPGKFNK